MTACRCLRCALYISIAATVVGVRATRSGLTASLDIDESGHLHMNNESLLAAEQLQSEERASGVRKQLLECMEMLAPGDANLNLHLPQIKLSIQRAIGLDFHMRHCTAGKNNIDAREDPIVQRAIGRHADYLLQFGVADLCSRIHNGSTWMGMSCGTTPYASGQPIRTPSDAVNSLRIWASMLDCKITDRFAELHDWGKDGMIRKAVKIAATHAVTALTSVLAAGGFALAANFINWGSSVMWIAEDWHQLDDAAAHDEAMNFVASIVLQAAALAVHGNLPLETVFVNGVKYVTLQAIDVEMTKTSMEGDLKLLMEAQVRCKQHHDLQHEAEVLQAIVKGEQPLFSGKCKEDLMAPYPGETADFIMQFGCVCSSKPPWSNKFCPQTDEATCTSINGHKEIERIQEGCNQHTTMGFARTHKYCAWKPIFADREDTCLAPTSEPLHFVTETSIDVADAMAACVCTQSGGAAQRYCASFEVGDSWMDQLTLRSRIVYAQQTADAQEFSRLTNICKQATMKLWYSCLFPGCDYASCEWKITPVKLDGGDCYRP